VGESPATRAIGLKGEDFRSQEYLIRITDRDLILIGRDWQDTETARREAGCDTQLRSLGSWRRQIDYGKAAGRDRDPRPRIELPGILDDQGTCYAAYDFLERFCEVRWYGPTPLNVVIPSRKTLTIPAADIRRSPSLRHRYGEGGNWPLINAQWNRPAEEQLQLYYRRLRMGGEKWAGNHSFSSFHERFGRKPKEGGKRWEADRPDFFAVGWEKEGNWRQLCLTNPDLVRQVAQDARDYFDGKGLKGSQPACGDYFAIVPQDSDHWCQCERCQAALAPGKARDVRGAFGTGTASDYYFGFVNAVARELARTHPGKYVAALAYHVYSYPPTFRLEPNVAVAPCVQLCYGYAKGVFANDEKFYNEWIAAEGGKRPLFVWNYFHHPMELAIIQGWKAFPCFMPDVISTWVKRYRQDGVHGYYLCGIGEQLDYYLYMQTAFNTDTDCTGLVHEFFERYFGPAGEPMEKFYYRISEINREEHRLGTTPEASWGRLGTEARMQELGTLIQRAVELATREPEKQRLETWRKGVWDYMVDGRRQYVQKKRAREKKEFPLGVFGTGVDDDHKLLADGAVDPHWRLTRTADDRWKGPETFAATFGRPAAPAGEVPASKWIVPSRDLLGVARGKYVYEQTFRLDGVAPETASIVGRITGDDVVTRIELNGADLGQSGADFAAWRELIIADHFVAGTNTLRIHVQNDGQGLNPHGLRVELSGSADAKR
jgi:hypothetical protein